MAKGGEKKNTKKLAIMLIIACVLVAVGAVAAVIVTNGGKLSDVASAKLEQEEEHVLEMESFVVNLTTPDGSNSYVKTQISLVYSEKKKADMLSEKSNLIRDIIIKDFMEYSPDQLLASGGLDSVKEQLKSDINASLGEEVVTGIYFTDFLIQ